jgi:tRNA threonylcarbamoyl adenosine modification protein (Sua5/YciO/YrdC/YwlC family)
MIAEINKTNPQKRIVLQAAAVLKNGGVIIYPTDSVYAYGCDIHSKSAIEKIYRLKKADHTKMLSFVFHDISTMSQYVKNMPEAAFRVMKKHLPGAYTLIFQGSTLVPKIVLSKQKTIGVRIPANNFALELVREMNGPILTASVNNPDGDYIIDPIELEKVYRNEVDLVISEGEIVPELSTVIDYSSGKAVLVRKGKGNIDFLQI